ncbi:hypothetical protein KP509_04G038200 [Ceratopteris richardii]|uniref:BZIP domain-containing protein n=1 Tax=Ceratopteris richardii TaxID=49495 RepID=A0A8T2US46_CERRI|nr:hypothetical protein KP509_04G038200 [Ceratopteris richardii]KAH7438948.1 hypothetical protein KP509_04G038200 [Ceratopteris richardii]
MGSGEMGTPTKTTKTSTPQEQTPPAATTSAMMYPEWAAAFQAYYGSGMSPLPHPGYYPSTMGSGPQPHPYMWGAQPLVPPPFGTPPPYAALYPHGGMYGHPPMTPVATSVGTDAEAKADEKKKSSKKSKEGLGSLGMLTGKTGDTGKPNATAMNGVTSNSGDSGSEGSSDGSEGMSAEGSQELQKSNFDQTTAEAPTQIANSSPYGSGHDVNHPMGNHSLSTVPISIGGKQVVGAGPVTNLNIGMDYWSGGTPGLLASNRAGMRGALSGNSTSMIPPSTNQVSGESWLQDERELKRQRRKQSNRESARRSRLRKQAECEELASKVQILTSENTSLRDELNRMTEECKRLSAENSSLLEQLHMPRSEAVHGELAKMNSNISKSDVLGDGLQLDHDSL